MWVSCSWPDSSLSSCCWAGPPLPHRHHPQLSHVYRQPSSAMMARQPSRFATTSPARGLALRSNVHLGSLHGHRRHAAAHAAAAAAASSHRTAGSGGRCCLCRWLCLSHSRSRISSRRSGAGGLSAPQPSVLRRRSQRAHRRLICASLEAGGDGSLVPLGLDFLTFLATTVLVIPLFKSVKASPVLGCVSRPV